METGLGVGEVARLAGVSVRTLHHYDQLRLLVPGARTRSGYRQYGAADIDRLQRILYYRDLGFALDDIAALLDLDGDPMDHLRLQHQLLTTRLTKVRRMLTTLEATMEAHEMGIRLTPQEMLEVFGDHDPTQHADEARERWGETDAYRESQDRTRRYTKQDWLQIKAEEAAMLRDFATAMADGEPTDGPSAIAAAQAHRDHISRWFYEVTPRAHIGLADLFLADPRFTEHYEQVAPGLAQFVHDAIHANASRQPG